MQMLHSITSRQRFPPLLVAAVVFLLAAVVSAGAIWRIAQADSRALRERAAFEATIHAHALERSIERSLSATYALAALIREGNGAIRNFDAVARQMLPLYPGATSLQLAPRGIVQYIVPLAGNEKAIGHNLLQDPARTKAAIVARDTGKLTLDGPFPLLQGGMGAVGRLPVFLDSAGGPTFWGFTSVVIRFPDVIETARFVGLAELGLAYQLWRTDPVTGQRAIIATSSTAAMIDPVQKIIAVPNAVWTLSVVPVNGWRQNPLKFLFEAALGLFLSALLGYAAKLLIELRAHKRELEARVERRTAEVKARETDLNRAQSIARVGSWVVDLPGHKVRWSAEASRLLGESTGVPFDRDAFLERVHPEDRAAVDRAWQETLAGKPLDLEHRVGVGTEKTRWVHTRADPEFAADGTLRRIVGTVQDISERKRAEDEIRHYTSQLEQAMRGTIGVINAIGEVRDPYTHGHERRVGEIAAAIGAEMGLDTNRVEGIRIAGYMHDVGKIGVPAEILSKPSKLSRIEYELVKSHAERGYEILKSFEFPWPVADFAWQHHERLDGSGYPRGLKGDAILLDARILAIADVVEAMSSHRPYRPGLGIEPALAEISKGAGTLYDPQAVAACLRLFHDKGYRLPE